MSKLEGLANIQLSTLTKIDQYFRSNTTLLASALRKISPDAGVNYLDSKTKRVTDLAVGVPATIVSLPVIGVLAGVNKVLYPTDPAFFHQKRLGPNNSIINVIKIRTMKPNSDYSDTGVDVHYGKPAWENPYNTDVGQFMRKFDFDELPQLAQVVKGEMSLIGIRNIAPAIIEDLHQKWSKKRFESWMKSYNQSPSGLAALAQIEGNGIKEDKNRFHLDTFYAKHANLGFDFYLIWKTGLRLLKRLI